MLLLITLGLGLGFLSNAQDQKAKSNESEIVMTKSELESFLAKIAERKREQIAKRNNELRVNQEFNNSFEPKDNTYFEPKDNTDDRMYREFDRINQRIDMLMMNAGNRMNTYAAPQMQQPAQAPAVIYQQPAQVPAAIYQQPAQAPDIIYQQPAQAPTVIYQQQPPIQNPPIQKRELNEAPTPFNANAPSEETLLLQKKVNTLKEEVRVLTLLSNNKKDGEYDQEIESLKSKINELNIQVEKKNQAIHDNTVIYIKKDDALKKGLENYRHDIFYANNSSAISNADKEKLDEVIAIVKEHNPRVTIMVQGFASKTGNAKYNSQLSFNRAEAVKQYLLSKGLNARNIITMYHGVDQGTNETNARRTEISLLVE